MCPVGEIKCKILQLRDFILKNDCYLFWYPPFNLLKMFTYNNPHHFCAGSRGSLLRAPRGGIQPMSPHPDVPKSCIYAKVDPSKKTVMEIRSFHNTSSSSSHSLRRPDSPGDGLSDVSAETPLVSSSSEDGRSSSASAPQCPVPRKVLEGLNRESAV